MIRLTKHRRLFKEKTKHSWTLLPTTAQLHSSGWEGVTTPPVSWGDAGASCSSSGCPWRWHIPSHSLVPQ